MGVDIVDNLNPESTEVLPEQNETVVSEDTLKGDEQLLNLIETEYKDVPSLKTIKDVGTLLKSYVNAQQLIGKKTIGIPDDTYTPDQINTFYEKLGKPENSEDYELTETYSSMFGEDKGKEFDTKLKIIFSKNNLTKEQAKQFQLDIKEMAELVKIEMDEMKNNKMKETTDELDKFLSKDLNKRDIKSKKTLDKILPKEFNREVIGSLDEIGKNTLTLVLNQVYDTYIKEDTFPDSRNVIDSNKFDIQEKIHEILKNPNYNKPSSAEYPILREKMRTLQTKKLNVLKN